MRVRHKPVLFDQLRRESQPKRRSWKIALYNGAMQCLYGAFRIIGVLLASAICSLLLTAFVTAVSQNISMIDALIGLWERILVFFN